MRERGLPVCLFLGRAGENENMGRMVVPHRPSPVPVLFSSVPREACSALGGSFRNQARLL